MLIEIKMAKTSMYTVWIILAATILVVIVACQAGKTKSVDHYAPPRRPAPRRPAPKKGTPPPKPVLMVDKLFANYTQIQASVQTALKVACNQESGWTALLNSLFETFTNPQLARTTFDALVKSETAKSEKAMDMGTIPVQFQATELKFRALKELTKLSVDAKIRAAGVDKMMADLVRLIIAECKLPTFAPTPSALDVALRAQAAADKAAAEKALEEAKNKLTKAEEAEKLARATADQAALDRAAVEKSEAEIEAAQAAITKSITDFQTQLAQQTAAQKAAAEAAAAAASRSVPSINIVPKPIQGFAGAIIAINGNNFVKGKTTVTVDGVTSNSVIVNGTNVLYFIVPMLNSPGVKTVVVTTPGGSTTYNNLITYTTRRLTTQQLAQQNQLKAIVEQLAAAEKAAADKAAADKAAADKAAAQQTAQQQLVAQQLAAQQAAAQQAAAAKAAADKAAADAAAQQAAAQQAAAQQAAAQQAAAQQAAAAKAAADKAAADAAAQQAAAKAAADALANTRRTVGELTTFTSNGTYYVPSWANRIDVIVNGAGGNGLKGPDLGGNLGAFGNGGTAGKWDSTTLYKGQFPSYSAVVAGTGASSAFGKTASAGITGGRSPPTQAGEAANSKNVGGFTYYGTGYGGRGGNAGKIVIEPLKLPKTIPPTAGESGGPGTVWIRAFQ